MDAPPPLEEVVTLLAAFLMPPVRALVSHDSWNRNWNPAKGEWTIIR